MTLDVDKTIKYKLIRVVSKQLQTYNIILFQKNLLKTNKAFEIN